MEALGAYFAQLDQSCAELRGAKPYSDHWKIYRERMLNQLPQLIGEFSQAELKPKLLERVEEERYFRERIEFSTLPNLRATAYVLVPKKMHPQSPVVLACHGHGYGVNEAIGLSSDGERLMEDFGSHNQFAANLANKGCSVIVPELIGFGERRWDNGEAWRESNNSCHAMSVQLMMYGKTLPGLRTFEMFRTIDLLVEHLGAEPGRIGCFGFSGGGLIAALTSALDPRISAAVISCYTNTFKGSIMSMMHCIDNYIPGMLQYAEMPELIGLIAPKPLFIEAGIEDRILPIQYAQEAYESLQEIYQVYEAEHRLDYHFYPGEHKVNGSKSIDWLIDQLT